MRYRTLTLKEGTMINDGIIEGLSADVITATSIAAQGGENE
jgi:hypothetical protein